MSDQPKPEPKKRILRLEPQILAYLGDYLNLLEDSVKRLVMKEIQATKPPNIQNTSVQ